MKQNKIYLLLLILIGAFQLSCERDEICIDAITPKLTIRFYDIDDPEIKKSVNGLIVEAEINEELDTVHIQLKDSISLPLNVYDTQTTFILTKNSTDPATSNKDKLIVTYEVKNVFVGRSCGYKSIFKNVTYTIEDVNSDGLWIKSKEVISEHIENENNAHLKIFH
ncbi:MAG TPA: hypothetical protein DDZ39_04285 [Flavobacteriaceae bacterium]|jgi:hypothetical protein|nr:hypothetical protein [Flavobacteriaceae bacterium]HBS12588.1 hypothetical protein [Flavobacteriaceae bacterium]